MDPNPTTLDFLTPKFPPPINDDDSSRRRLADYVDGLEAERRKIEAFRRELPLCLELLNDAVERFGEELRKSREAVDCNLGEVKGLNLENGVDDMKNWMSSAQLWNHHANDSPHHKSMIGEESVPNGSSDDKLLLLQPVVVPVVELDRPCAENVVLNSGKTVINELKVQKKTPQQPALQPVCRKQRRCWSPELHRMFVDALKQLGGSEVATPKQIRDIMRVEGLTNDEVKSHLQKYRLHIRKAPCPFSPTSTVPTASQDDILSKLNSKSQSKSPQGPLDRSVASGKSSTSKSNNTMHEEDEEEETEGHSWRDRVIFRPCLPAC
ncbi:hypothetical protein QQ045_025181 [Rhodiola kirilowii]